MKSTAIIILSLVTGLLSSRGQSLKFGLRAGANIYKIDGKSFDDEFNYGYHAGGAVELMFGKVIGIQPEVLFNQSNLKTGYSFDTLYNTVDPGMIKEIRLNHLSLPILLNVKVFPFMTLQAGPQFGILMSQDKDLLEDGEEAFKNGNLSILTGVQFNVAMFRIYARYGFGMTNLNNIDGKDEWKSRGAQLGVGFNF